jgi:hypothetical protein
MTFFKRISSHDSSNDAMWRKDERLWRMRMLLLNILKSLSKKDPQNLTPLEISS